MEKIRLIGNVFVDEHGNDYLISANELYKECIDYLYEVQTLRIRDIFCGAVAKVFPGMTFVPNTSLRSNPLFLEIEENISANAFYLSLKKVKDENRLQEKNKQAEIAAYKAAQNIRIFRKKSYKHIM